MSVNNRYLSTQGAPCPVLGLRRTLCRAGVSALLAVGLAVPFAAQADVASVPDSGWTPDGLPVIRPDGTDSDPEPTPAPDPDPTPAPTPDDNSGGNSDDSGGDVPDSGDTTPGYDELYPNGGGSTAASEDAFADASAATGTAAQQDQDVATVGTVAPPRFTAFDESARTVTGMASAGVTVRMLDGQGNVLAEAVAAADGTFALTLPEGVALAEVSLVAVTLDEAGAEQVSAALSGATMAAAAQAAQTDAVRQAVGTSTTELACGLVASLTAAGLASEAEEPQASELPVLPYVLGAGSALVAVGAVAGAVYAVRRVGRGGDEDAASHGAALEEVLSPVASAPAPMAALNRDDTDAPNVSWSDGEMDELERLAVSLSAPTKPVAASTSSGRAAHFGPAAGVSGAPSPDDDPDGTDGPGGGAPRGRGSSFSATSVTMPGAASTTSASASVSARAGGLAGFAGADPDGTLPCPAVSQPSDPATFAAVARILATGSGTVHRVVATTHDCDFTGLELVDGQDVTVAAERVDPLVEEDDWCAVALRELMGDEAPVPGGKTAPTLADTAHSPQGTSRPARDEAGQTAYVAPVIGPSSVTPEEAARRHALLETAATPAAQAVRQRDEEFRAQRTRATRALREQEGVPQITRGFAVCAAPAAGSPSAATPGPQRRERSVSDLVPAVERLIHVPDLDASSPAAGMPQISTATPATLHDTAVAAAASAYAAFGSVGEGTIAMPALASASAARQAVPAARPAPKRAAAPAPDPATVSSSIAAAYAAAVYADVRVPEQVPASVSVKPAPEPIADETAPLSAAYIDYLVRDEMEHRHDTIAQRNAATGAYRVISGAQGVVSVRDGIALRRYLA